MPNFIGAQKVPISSGEIRTSFCSAKDQSFLTAAAEEGDHCRIYRDCEFRWDKFRTEVYLSFSVLNPEDAHQIP